MSVNLYAVPSTVLIRTVMAGVTFRLVKTAFFTFRAPAQ